MGGRGSSSSISARGNKYGSQYKTLLQVGNIKFISKNSRQSEDLLETRVSGRIYVTIGGNSIQKITFFDSENDRTKTIEFNHNHKGLKNGHVHHGYFHNEYDTEFGATNPSDKERELIDKVKRIWENHGRKSK